MGRALTDNPAHDLRHQNEGRARLTADLPLGLLVVDAAFRVSVVSAGAQPVFAGIDPLIGRDFAEVQRILLPEPFATEVITRFRHTLTTGEPYQALHTAENRANRDAVESYDWQIERLALPDGSFCLFCHFYDTSRLRHAEQAKWQSEQRYYAMATATAEVAYGMSADWSILYPLDGRGLVATNAEPIHDWLTKNIPPEEHARIRVAQADALARKSLFELEHRVFAPNGSVAWAHSRAVPILDEAGNITEWFGIAADITDRKRDEAALCRSEQEFRALFESAPGLYLVLRHNLTIAAVSDAYAAATMRRREDLLGRHVFEAFPDNPGDTTANGVSILAASFNRVLAERVADTMAPIRYDIALPDGSFVERWWSPVNSPVLDDDGQVMFIIHRAEDVTEYVRSRASDGQSASVADMQVRVESELYRRSHEIQDANRRLRETLAALHESEERHRLALESGDIGAWRIDLPSLAFTSDERFQTIFCGRPRVMTYEEAFACIHPDDAERVSTRVAAAIRPVDPEPYEAEYRLIHSDGTTHWAYARGRTNFGGTKPDRRATSVDGTVIEITDRKRIEEAIESARRSAEVARDAAENASLAKDRFLAVLSHELRTPLTPVVMAVTAMEQNPEIPPWVRNELAMVRRNVALEVKLIDDLLDLSRVTSGKLLLRREPIAFNQVVRDACQTTRSLAQEKGVHLDCDLGPHVNAVNADPARLQQVLWNLIRNSAKFTPQGGRITVTTTRNGDTVRAVVADTGMGIAREDLARVFNAFEQADASITREFGGMGLGLAISKSIVELHGGTIYAYSAGPGLGATFTVELPALSASIASVGNGNGKGHVKDNGKEPVHGDTARDALRVLLVEDHVDTARMLARLLGRSGHAVQAAHNSADALALAAREPFDLVVSDIGLPDGTGYDLMTQLRSRHGLVGIAMSGYGMDEDVRRSREAGFAEHLLKPVNFDELERTLRRVATTASRGA